ncbi:unnamed protein product [Peronospora effusa]|nr:unnamed protein product [Peronospora effusa]
MTPLFLYLKTGPLKACERAAEVVIAQQRQTVATETTGDRCSYREERRTVVEAANAAAQEATPGEEPVDEEAGEATNAGSPAEKGPMLHATPETLSVEAAAASLEGLMILDEEDIAPPRGAEEDTPTTPTTTERTVGVKTEPWKNQQKVWHSREPSYGLACRTCSI